MTTEIEAPTEEIPYHLWKEDNTWVARDERTGVASQGETRQEALENLDEAVALYRGEIGRKPTDAELRELGVEPKDNTSGELPDVLRDNRTLLEAVQETYKEIGLDPEYGGNLLVSETGKNLKIKTEKEKLVLEK